jgi:chemotaxis signal transduction protein
MMERIESGAADVKEYLSFRLGAEEYGIDILAVREIRPFERPTRIANAPEFILGVVNLRGVIVPIVDLRIKFGMAQALYDGSTVVIILNVADRVLGIVVDSVSDVLPLKGRRGPSRARIQRGDRRLVRAGPGVASGRTSHPGGYRDADDEPRHGARR